jgi:hypothetical protein
VRPRKLKFRAPWRWRWHLILGLLLRCGAWALALAWSTWFAVPLSLWVALQIAAGYRQPHSPGPSQKGLENETAGQFVFTQDDPARPNHWRVSHRE